MNKEPLRSFEVGLGSGKTAKELGLKEIYHGAPDFFVWTVISRSKKGTANVFQSREDIPGELAFYGQGFYTGISKDYGDYIIPIELSSMARAGSDFILRGSQVVIQNKNAIEVVPGKLDVGGITGYLKLSRNGGNRPLLLKAKRDIEATLLVKKEPLPKKEIKKIASFVVEKTGNYDNRMLRFLFSLNLPLKHSGKIISKIITESQNNMNETPLFYLARSIFPGKRVELKNQIDQVIKIAQKTRNQELLVEMLPLFSLPADKLESKK